MDRIVCVLHYQWRAYWRRFTRPGAVSAANHGLVLILSAYLFLKYVGLLDDAAAGLATGKTAMLERLLSFIFLSWLFPLMSNPRLKIGTGALLHMPLSSRQLFSINALSLLIPPYAWMIAAGSLAICYPLAYAPNTLAGITTALLFIVASWLGGLTISQLLRVAIWRRLFIGALVAMLISAACYVIIGNPPTDFLRLLSFSPITLVARAAVANEPWLGIGVWAAITAVAYQAALWTFRQSLEVSPNRRLEGTMRLPLSFYGKTGGLSGKDVRYFRRLLDPYFGLLASGLCCLYLMSAHLPSPGVVFGFIIVIIAPNASVAFNYFGLDNRSGLDRYALFPLAGKEIIFSKGVACLVIISVQLFPVILLTSWRLGLDIAALGVIESASLALAFLSWGNWIAVTHIFKMQFFRFASGGPPLDAIGGLAFGSVPGVLMLRLFHERKTTLWFSMILVMLFYGVLYFHSMKVAGRKFERKQETF